MGPNAIMCFYKKIQIWTHTEKARGWGTGTVRTETKILKFGSTGIAG